MKLSLAPVAPADHWRRFLGVCFDYASAAGEDVEAAGVRVVRTRPVSGLAAFGDAEDDRLVGPALSAFGADPAEWPVWLTLATDVPALASRRYESRSSRLTRLNGRRETRDVPHVMVLPGRAAWAALGRGADDGRIARERSDHFDDPAYEPLVALRDRRVVGLVALQNRGQTGLMTDLFVVPEARRQGIASLLLGRVAELAARGQLVDVYAEADSADAAATAALARNGFAESRTFTRWRPPLRS